MQALLDEEGRPAGPHRVYLPESNMPGLAVSRCFGDLLAAGAGVTSTPDVITLLLPTGGAGSGSSSSSSPLAGSKPAPTHRGRRQQQPPLQQQQPTRAASQGQGRRPQRGASPAVRGRRQQPGGRQQVQGRHRQRGGGRPGAGEASHILIVASDGLWEFVSNAEAVRIASRWVQPERGLLCGRQLPAAGLCAGPPSALD